MASEDELLAAWAREAEAPFSGWDFSRLAGRMTTDEPPWSYADLSRHLLREAQAVLDVDTGGGERFAALSGDWPALVFATEAHPPNVALARARLEPLGATVIDTSAHTERIPLGDGSLDLILNRHGSISPAEVARLLPPGGRYLTEGVHAGWASELVEAFGRPCPTTPTAESDASSLRAVGLDVVDVRDAEGSLTFMDVGAIVYYLRAVPWLVPGFSIDRGASTLFALQHRLEATGALVFSARTYLVQARQPARSARGPGAAAGAYGAP